MKTEENNNGINADAESKIRSHSIPCNEASRLLQGCRAVTAFIASQYVNFSFRCTELLQVHYQIDLSCLGSWQSLHVLHKQVLVRNMCTQVHNLCQDLSKDFPLQISFSHVAGIKNISDYNSKLVPGQYPISLINSTEWRHGNPGFTNSDFPG